MALMIIPCPYPFRVEDRQPVVTKDISLFCVFGHVSTGLRAEVEEVTVEEVITRIFDAVPIP